MASLAIPNTDSFLTRDGDEKIDERSFLNSKYGYEIFENKGSHDITGTLIEFHKKIDAQFYEMENIFSEIGLRPIKEQLTELYNYCLDAGIELLKAELTQDCTLFSTLKKGKFTIYIDSYLEDNDSNAVLFRGNKKLPSTHGDLEFVMRHIKQALENEQ